MGLHTVTWRQNHVSVFRLTECRVTVQNKDSYSGSTREQKKIFIYIGYPGAGTAQLVCRLRFELANREIVARSQTRHKDTSSTKSARHTLESTANF